jgi:formylglycine-generating enzyme required for sulfatase activity
MKFPALGLVAGLIVLCPCRGQDTAHRPEGQQISGPQLAPDGAPTDRDAWLTDLRIWRAERLTRMGYDDAQYRRPEFKWAQRNFIAPQVMVEERTLFDVVHNRWTVDRYLDDLDARYGGIDSVLLWPVYPNIGIDNRNQWDLARDLPGGLAGLRAVVQQFHRRGVRVLLPTMPWDNGTRDPGVSHWVATARLMAEAGVDGVNGDTFSGLPLAYRTASDRTGHPVIFQPEGPPASDEQLAWNNQSWAYFDFKFAPTANKLKWIESRHMPDISDRWARDKTHDLHAAFFNGIGYVSWENIWGIWNQITDRDAEALRRVAAVERQFAALLVSPDWEPFVPTLRRGIFGTKFPGRAMTLFLLINQNDSSVAGQELKLAHAQGRRYFDVWHGVELVPRLEGGEATLDFEMEPQGYGAVLAVDSGAAPPGLGAYLARIGAMTAKPLADYSHDWHFLPQKMVETDSTRPVSAPPSGMLRIPAGDFDFRVSGIEIEGFDWEGLDVQYPWESVPKRGHDHVMHLASFYMDRYPVTNADFEVFLKSSGYHPLDGHNFLRDWRDGKPRPGWERKPVTWVSLEDARAYAKWAGKRLPHEWEWQYCAQGTDGRLYPWGNTWDPGAVPEPDKGRDLTGPSNVDAHPSGASPFGIMDLTGNVWQWTDEFVDAHTRAAILRGGSYYQPQGSMWYFPQAYKLGEHGKYLLMAPSKDRAGTLGFRCAADAP